MLERNLYYDDINGAFMWRFDLQLEFPELNVAGFYLQSYLNVVFSYSCKYLVWFLF